LACRWRPFVARVRFITRRNSSSRL
jgi:hypothetical protein